MKITSRSRFSLPASAIGISVMASSPGPPASQTIGSGLGSADAAGMMATERVIVRRVGLLRFSGTVSCPQRAVLSSGIGAGISGHTVFSNRYSGSARAKAMPPTSVAMASRAPTAASDPKVVRVHVIWQLLRWQVRNDGERWGGRVSAAHAVSGDRGAERKDWKIPAVAFRKQIIRPRMVSAGRSRKRKRACGQGALTRSGLD